MEAEVLIDGKTLTFAVSRPDMSDPKYNLLGCPGCCFNLGGGFCSFTSNAPCNTLIRKIIDLSNIDGSIFGEGFYYRFKKCDRTVSEEESEANIKRLALFTKLETL